MVYYLFFSYISIIALAVGTFFILRILFALHQRVSKIELRELDRIFNEIHEKYTI